MLERIAFLVDETGERISALLNPESIRLRRQSGLRRLDDRPGTITGAHSTDDPLIATSGGRTEMELDLLFDVALLPARAANTVPTPAGPDSPVPIAPPAVDVRTLTGPLWALAENTSITPGPATGRIVWGKHLNVAVVVEAVSERLERFDASGIPSRSYLSLRLVRIAEPDVVAEAIAMPSVPPISTAEITPRAPIVEAPDTVFHEVLGSAGGGERLDQIAAQHYGNAAYWRHLAAVNAVDDPPWVEPGRILVIPSIDVLAAPTPPAGVAGVAGVSVPLEPTTRFHLDVDTTLVLDPVGTSTRETMPR